MSTVQEILNAASALPSADRLQLIHALSDTIAPDDWPNPSKALIEEVHRRTAALEQGKETSVGWSEARAAARREAGLDG